MLLASRFSFFSLFSPLPAHPATGLDLCTQLKISQYNLLPPQQSYNNNIIPILNDQPEPGLLDLYFIHYNPSPTALGRKLGDKTLYTKTLGV
jgi:hypothetical protein